MKKINGIGNLDVGLSDNDYKRLIYFLETKSIDDISLMSFGYHINRELKKYGLDIYYTGKDAIDPNRRWFKGKFYLDDAPELYKQNGDLYLRESNLV